MALTKTQVREILSAAGVDNEHMKDAVEKIIDGHLASVDALREDVSKYKAEAEKLSGVQQELETLKASSGDAAAIQKKLDELQAKYDTDIADRDAKLADRDYSDAVTAFIAEKGLKFSSKGAERDFRAAFKEKVERKDGAFVGADDFLKERQESDPDAFTKEGGVRVDLGGSLGGGTPETGPTTLAGALRERYEQQKG